MKNEKLIIAKQKFNSRLIVGTGKYKSMSECAKAIKFSGADIVLRGAAQWGKPMQDR